MPDNYYTLHFHTTMNLDPACTVFHSLFLHEYKSNSNPASIREEMDFLVCRSRRRYKCSNQSFFGVGAQQGARVVLVFLLHIWWVLSCFYKLHGSTINSIARISPREKKKVERETRLHPRPHSFNETITQLAQYRTKYFLNVRDSPIAYI